MESQILHVIKKGLFILCCIMIGQSGICENPPNKPSEISKTSNYHHLSFIENTGQLFEECAFFARPGFSYMYVLNNGDIVYSSMGKGDIFSAKDNLIEHLSGSEDSQIIPSSSKAAYVYEYFNENHGAKKFKSRKYESLLFHEVVRGISMDLAVNGSTIEKRFYISPFSNPQQISFTVTSAHLSISATGDLIMASGDKQIIQKRPFAYQETNGVKRIVDVSYKINDHTYRFEIGAYDPSLALIIDPLLGGTYCGGELGTGLVAIDMDNQGNVFVTGTIILVPDDIDVAVFKFNNDLSVLLEEAYIYGSGQDYGMAIKLDQAGNIFVAGKTNSVDFPVIQGSFDLTHNDSLDLFISKISNDCQYLLSSTYLGGSKNDGQYGVNLDIGSTGEIIIAADSDSPDLPIAGTPFQSSNAGYRDGYVAKLNNNLTTLIASSYLGGLYDEGVTALKVAPSGTVYVSGHTWSINFPHTEGTMHVGPDAYITQLNSNLSSISKSIFLGGSAVVQGSYTWEYGCDIVLDHAGNVILAGGTMASDFQPVTPGVFQPTLGGGSDFFISKFDQNLNVISSGFFGGTCDEGTFSTASCDVSPTNDIYLAGCTYSTQNDNFPLSPGSFDITYNGTGDGSVSLLNSGLTQLKASTYYGGNQAEGINDLIVDYQGNVFVCGTTGSFDLPTTSTAYSRTKTGPTDGFVAKFDSSLSPGFLSIRENENMASERLNLRIYPNPCRVNTSVSFTLDEPAEVQLQIVDIHGSVISTPVQHPLSQGKYEYHFDVTDDRMFSNQIYFVNLEVKSSGQIMRANKKLVVLN